MATTIYDIAREVKTSAVTVSLALRDSKRVSDATKRRIKQKAKELGYQSNPLARGLVGAQTKTLAFIFNYPSSALVNDMAFTAIFNAVAHRASVEGYKLFFHSSTTAKPVDEALNEARSYGVDGIVLISRLNSRVDKDALRQSEFPVVVFGRDVHAKRTTCALPDDSGGARLAVEHLLELGHRRIVFVGKHESEAAIRRYEAYRTVMAEAGITVERDWVIECGYDVVCGGAAGQQLAKLNPAPTAVVTAGDLLAIGVIAGLRKCGLNVPSDVSVTGFDNLTITQFTSPTLTTIEMPRETIADVIVESLVGMINDESDGQRKIIPAKLVVRESTGPCRA